MIDKNKIYGYDFEVYSKINWFCVTFVNYLNRDDVIQIVNDRQELIDFYNQHKDCIFVSYNGRQYDTGIWKGIMDGLSPGYVNDKLIKEGRKPFQVVKNARKYPLNDYDCIIKDRSLKVLEAFMGDDIRETEVGFDIDRPLTDEEIELTLFYNKHDVLELLKVFDNTQTDFEGQLDIIELYNLDMNKFTKTKVQLAARILNAVPQHTMDDEFDIRLPETIEIPQQYRHIPNWFLNPKNWRYKEHLHSEDNQHPNQYICDVAGIPHVFAWGGAHGCDEKESVFEGLILHCDVSSMYPTIDIVYKLLSRKVRNPDDLRQMRDFRLEMKAAHNPKNVALKPLINGVFGASKDRNNPMYDPLMANLTCIFGQMIILDLISHVEPYSRLLQTNTDGIFVLCKNEEMKQKVIEITNEVGKRLSMEFEIDEFRKLIQKDVNNYIAIDINGKAECKGSFVKYNTPIDNDLPILNDAVREYLINGTPVEDTINNCTDLIKFQKVIKLSAKYNEVWYGKPIQDKISSEGETKTKITSIDGKRLKEKVHRAFASTNKNDGGIYKLKVEKGSKSYEKFGYTPESLFIDNSDIHEKPIPEHLDREYYINEAKKRINMFLIKDEVKEDNTGDILYKCMIESDSFYDFLVKRKENNIPDKVLREYILADCCKVYGNAGKLLSFMDYFFKGIYGLKLMRVTTIDKKYPEYKDIIMSCGENKTGKTITSFDYEKCLKSIFDVLPDDDIHPYVKMSAQISLFNTIHYTDENLGDNVYFILNVRNVIAPNLIMYNMRTGKFEYRKIDKDTFSILPLYDGDIIEVTNQREEYAMKITGKDAGGINIVEADIDKKHNLITSYEILYRHYGKNTKLISDCEDN